MPFGQAQSSVRAISFGPRIVEQLPDGSGQQILTVPCRSEYRELAIFPPMLCVMRGARCRFDGGE
jgi:hypothetical protein